MKYLPEQHIREVADGIVAFLNGEGEMGVANACSIFEQDRALVVDTMTFPEMVAPMVEEIRQRNAHVTMVLNTHHHIDHLGGNKVFADVPIVAHPTSIQFLQRIGFSKTMYDRLMPQFQGRFDDLELKMPAPLSERPLLPHGGELLLFSPAHTVADLAVWFPASRVLLAGDLSFIEVTPLAVHGLLSGWIEAIDSLLALDPEVVVPGHGRIGGKADLVMQRNYLAALHELGQSVISESLSFDDALAAFDAGPVSEWLEADRTRMNLERAIQEAQGEINRKDVSMLPPSIRRLSP